MVRGNVSRLTIGSENATYSAQPETIFSYEGLPQGPLAPHRLDQSLDAILFDLWMTVFAVFGGSAALAWLILYTAALLKFKARTYLDMPNEPTRKLPVTKIAMVSLWVVAYHLIIVAVWYAVPEASWVSAGLGQVAARSARFILKAEIGLSLFVGALLLSLKLVLD